MNRRTLREAIRGKYYIINPKDETSGIDINGIQVHPSNVFHKEFRVDIKSGSSAAFLIEHPVAVLAILGIHDASIQGTRDAWDFYRPADREAFSRELTPAAVVGPADGSLGGDLVRMVTRINPVEKQEPVTIQTLKKEVDLTFPGGNHVYFHPGNASDPVLKVRLSLFGLEEITALYHPRDGLQVVNGEQLDYPLAKALLSARSAAITGPSKEAQFHALGDLLGDIAITGRINCGHVVASLGMAYHRTTIGLGMHAREQDLIERVMA
ncbi:hypothetical protein GF325_06410 [Candidatus Bathyarchaeota archaeon]|nr:hypothetical protein [Candidatus Bathyarchaeota archaeon]